MLHAEGRKHRRHGLNPHTGSFFFDKTSPAAVPITDNDRFSAAC